MAPQESSHTPCQISDETQPWDDVNDIRKSVCRDLETSEHTDGKHYCLLHLPAKEKNAREFETIRKARFEEVEAAVSKLEGLPEEKRKVKLANISYDFRSVWFPANIDLSGYKFAANAFFSSAAFSGYAYFSSAAFSGNVSFSEAAFSGNAYFSSAAFSGYASFSEAAFSGDASFSEAAFSGNAYFSSAAFSGDASFSSAAFSGSASFSEAAFCGSAYFSSAAFSDNADFSSTTFSGSADFYKSVFVGGADFYKSVFLGNAQFDNTAFSGNAQFDSAAFSGNASFSSAAFSGYTSFSEAAFSGYAYFSSAAFPGDADFSSAAFAGYASFNWTIFQKIGNFENTIFFSDGGFYKTEFLETSECFFKKTKFCGNADFGQVMFEGFVSFEGDSDEKIFSIKDGVSKVRAELKVRFDKLKQRLSEKKIEFRVPDAFIDKTEYDLRIADKKEQGETAGSYEELQARIENEEAILDLQNARLKKPERITFHTARLRPNWFVNTDSRRMVFTDCRWDNIDQTGVKDRLGGKNKKHLNANIKAELQALTDREILEEKRLLEITCRQLAANAEENNRYEDASKFRYMAMEIKKLETPWYKRLFILTWWYRLSSSYGESWRRALFILLGIWLASAWAYTGFTFLVTPLPSAPIGFVRWEKKAQSAEEFANPAQNEDIEGEKFGFGKALWYSGAVMALQRPEPKPATNWTRGLIIIETILGPLQAALLALAIRRRFMR